jgi:branched-chain amino acid transport system ATP-binding protein
LLKIEALQVKFGSVVALQGISLEVREGELVGLVGPNGAGKSTTLNAVVGLVRPSAGSIDFCGRSLLGRPPDQIARDGIALVPEGRRLFSNLSVKDNLSLGLTVRHRDTSADQDREEVLDRFPALKRYYRSSAGKLSGGEQQQLAIARALLSRPRLMLLDEPSLGLAPIHTESVFGILDDLRRAGVTTLLVEQNVSRIITLADRTYVLRAGRIELEGSAATLAENAELAQAYLGA